MEKDKRRGERRDRSRRAARRDWQEHQRRFHQQDLRSACTCERTVWSFRKFPATGCNCRRREFGNPKVGRGLCLLGEGYRLAVRERIAGKRLARRWAGWWDESEALDYED